jgi:alanine-synthesizing transaminase
MPSHRAARVRYAIRDIVLVAEEARRAGKTLYPLNIGDPGAFDFPTPPHLIEAVERAMRAGANGYGDSIGLPDAREAIRADAARRGIRSVRDAFLCTGTSEGIEVVLAAAADAGDNVLVPRPGYPFYEAALNKLDIEARPYPLVEERGWAPDVDAMAAAIDGRTRAIAVINPNNPTGTIVPPETLKAILALARTRGLIVIADEIYNQLVLDGPAVAPLASLADDAIVVTFNGLSKAYLAPGWRMGWGVVSGPEREAGALFEAIARMLRARLCSPTPMMHAIRPALEGDHAHLKGAIEKLRRRRDVLMRALMAMPRVSCVEPKAAFYAFPRLKIDGTDEAFVRALIRETGVMAVHGGGFGQAEGTAHLRIVFLPPEEVLGEALEKLKNFLAGYRA